MNEQPILRLYRKGYQYSPKTKYRIAKPTSMVLRSPNGDMVGLNNYWVLWVEGEEELGCVYEGPLSVILEKYEVIEDKFGITRGQK